MSPVRDPGVQHLPAGPPAAVVGDNEPLEVDPVNIWAGTLLLAIALDRNRPRPELGRGKG